MPFFVHANHFQQLCIVTLVVLYFSGCSCHEKDSSSCLVILSNDDGDDFHRVGFAGTTLRALVKYETTSTRLLSSALVVSMNWAPVSLVPVIMLVENTKHVMYRSHLEMC